MIFIIWSQVELVGQGIDDGDLEDLLSRLKSGAVDLSGKSQRGAIYALVFITCILCSV